MSIKRKIVVTLLILFLCFIWWRVIFYNQKTGFKETAVEDGQTTFTAETDSVNYIVVAGGDIQLKKRLETDPAKIRIQIADEQGNKVAECITDGLNIHTNGYTSTENCTFSNLPVHLQQGQKYTFEYTAELADGTSISHLSFMLYGDTARTNRGSLLIFALITTALLIAFLTKRQQTGNYILIWVLLIAMTIVMMPVLQSDDETQAFAETYAMSNQLSGKKVCDPDGNVYIEESGIRNGGYLSYSVPLNRFWTDWNYGNVRNEGIVSSLYHISGTRVTVTMIPEILALTFARNMGMPYQAVMMSGWLINVILTGVLLLLSLKIAENNERLKRFLMILFLLPSTLIAACSYTGAGLLFLLCVLFYVICNEYSENRTWKEALAALILLMIIISVQYAYCVLAVMLPDINSGKKKRNAMLVLPVAEAVFCFIMHQISMLQKYDVSAGTYIGSVLNTVFSRTDGILREIVTYHYYANDEMVIVIYLTLAILLFMRFTVISERGQVTFDVKAVKSKAVVLWLAGVFLLMTYGQIAMEADHAYGVFDHFYGEALLPLLLLTGMQDQTQNDKADAIRAGMMKTVVICTVVISVMRMGKL